MLNCQKKSEEGKSQAEESKNDSDNDADVLRKEELFNKRHKDETPEERKQRKALIKQFKQERKEKKKKFKETFEVKWFIGYLNWIDQEETAIEDCPKPKRKLTRSVTLQAVIGQHELWTSILQ